MTTQINGHKLETEEIFQGFFYSVSKPIVNLCPYDIREIYEPHSNEWIMERDENRLEV